MDLQRELTKAGFVGTRNGKPLTLSTIGHFLRNPFYYGSSIPEELIRASTFDD